MKKILILLLAFILYFVISCSIQQDDENILKLTNEIFTNIQNQDYEKVMENFSDEMKKAAPKEYYFEYFNLLNQNLGLPISWELTSRGIKYADETYYVYKFKVKHQKADVFHNLVFIKVSANSYKLISYNFESNVNIKPIDSL